MLSTFPDHTGHHDPGMKYYNLAVTNILVTVLLESIDLSLPKW